MTRLSFLGLLSLVAITTASAQEADTLTAADGWRSSLVASLAGNQASYSNWQEGGIDALSVTASAEGAFDRVVGRFLTTQRMRFAYGVLRQDTLDFRKALDVARYAINAELATDNPFRPTAGFSARTQFAPGYDFSPTEEDYPSLTVVPGQELKVSDAFAPFVMTQSVGMAYRPGNGFLARSGLALKETIVSIERLRPVFGNAIDQGLRTEVGVDAEVGLEREVLENVLLRSRLYSFQAFGQVGNEAPDVLFENTLVLKVNDVLNVTLDGTAFYDADISDDVQLREALAVGIALALL